MTICQLLSKSTINLGQYCSKTSNALINNVALSTLFLSANLQLATSKPSVRTFFSISSVPLDNLPDVIYSISFLDFYQDGTLDLMANVQKLNSEGKRYHSIQPIYNNVGYDAFFLTLTLMGYRNYKTLLRNTEYVGACASFYVTLLSGELAPKTGNQMSQTGAVMQLPFLRFGLGRTNNYLTGLSIKLPRALSESDKNKLSFEWYSVFPNSDILVTPPPHEPIAGIPHSWHLEVLIEPTEKMILVCFFVVLTLVLMGIVIIRLSKREIEEDEEDDKYFRTIFA